MTDFHKKSDKDLHKLLRDKREALREFRFGSAGSRTRNVRQGRNMRKEVAQILTELKQRDLTASE